MTRDELLHFVDTSMDSESETYALLGDGIESLTVNYSSESSTTQWINQKSGSTVVSGITPSFDVDRQDCVDDATRTWIKSMVYNPPIGTEAKTYVVHVDTTSGDATNGYKAFRRKYVVTPTSFGGDAGGYVHDVVNFGGDGDQVEGKFVLSTKTFTPNP